eukprot:TRINITY_DN12667_c0_g1_i1.p1 TRINITY_DN12667_c0_g1~~TRINITY_DN12667_c0_g1_i1.p1  ORF type:complete len:391 (+),score=110.46 TRINITY_DN12667_c0_g1_i1:167-1174(+)
MTEIELVRKSDKRPPALLQAKAGIEKDIHKYGEYVRECLKVTETLDSQYQVWREEYDARKQECDSLDKTITVLNAQLEVQEMKQVNLERLNLDKENIGDHLKGMRSKRLALEDRLWKKEMELSQLWERCIQISEEYEELCLNLKLIPTTAKYANGFDYNISLGTSQDPQLTPDVKQHVKPNLQHFIQILRNSHLQMLDASITLTGSLDQLREKVKEKEFQVKHLQFECEKLDKLRINQKDSLESELASVWGQVASIQNEMDEVRNKMDLLAASSVQELSEEIENFGQFGSELQNRHSEYYNKVVNTLNLVAEYKAREQEALVSLRKHLQNVLETL